MRCDSRAISILGPRENVKIIPASESDWDSEHGAGSWLSSKPTLNEAPSFKWALACSELFQSRTAFPYSSMDPIWPTILITFFVVFTAQPNKIKAENEKIMYFNVSFIILLLTL